MTVDIAQTFSENFSIFPTEKDMKLWESLSRDEQVEYFKQEIKHAKESGVGSSTADEIKKRALESRIN